jgi:hypothetical protein
MVGLQLTKHHNAAIMKSFSLYSEKGESAKERKFLTAFFTVKTRAPHEKYSRDF